MYTCIYQVLTISYMYKITWYCKRSYFFY